MKRAVGIVIFGALAGFLLVDAPLKSAERPRREVGKLQVGDVAPTSQLAQVGQKAQVDLAKLQGKPVVLIFGSCT